MPAENPSRQGIVDLQGTPPPRSARLSGTPVPSLRFYWFGLLVANPHGSGALWAISHLVRVRVVQPLQCLTHIGTLHAFILQMLVCTPEQRKGTPLPRPLNPRLGGNSWKRTRGRPMTTLPSWHAQGSHSLLRCCIHSGQITRGTVALSSVWRRPRARRQLSPLLRLAHATHKIQTLPVASEIENASGEKISTPCPCATDATLKRREIVNLSHTSHILRYLPKSRQPSCQCVTHHKSATIVYVT
jgi:hypothetical protein